MPPGRLILPGPYDAGRLLAYEARPGALADVPDTREFMPVDVGGLEAMGLSQVGTNGAMYMDDLDEGQDDDSDIEVLDNPSAEPTTEDDKKTTTNGDKKRPLENGDSEPANKKAKMDAGNADEPIEID